MSKKKGKNSKAKGASSTSVASPWSLVHREVQQSWDLRKELIERIESYLRAKVIVYFTALSEEEL